MGDSRAYLKKSLFLLFVSMNGSTLYTGMDPMGKRRQTQRLRQADNR